MKMHLVCATLARGFFLVAAAICTPLAAHAQVAGTEKQCTPPHLFTLTVGFPSKETSVDRLTLKFKLTNRSGRPAIVDRRLAIPASTICTATDATGSKVNPYPWTAVHYVVGRTQFVTLRPGASVTMHCGWTAHFRDLSGELSPIKVVFTYDSTYDVSVAKDWGVAVTQINVSARPIYLRFVNGRVKMLSDKEIAGSPAKGK